MTFNIYLPTEGQDSFTFFTSIEASSQEEAEQLAQAMQENGELPEIYPY